MDRRPTRARIGALALLAAALTAPTASAESWAPVFSCRASNGKEIRVDLSGTTLRYRFGHNTRTSPEITLYAPASAYSAMVRGGRAVFEGADGYLYDVVANSPGVGMNPSYGVGVTRHGAHVAWIPCARGPDIDWFMGPDMGGYLP